MDVDRIAQPKFCAAVEFRIQQRAREIIIVNLKLAAPACGVKLAALVIASVLVASCGGGGHPANSVPTLMPAPVANGSNTMAVVVDAGPVANAPEINVPYVSVTVCTPGTSGTTAACQTIDHVQLDTGSSGLRLLNTALYSNLNLPPVTSAAGEIGECAPFVIGTTWGSVRYADIYLGGEVARNVPIQDIGDAPGGFNTVPSDCSGTGTIQDSQASMGSNGILGIGLFQNDCELCQTQVISATYYTCNTSGCINSTVAANQVVQNPVADFAQDNNGTQINLPAVSSAGANTSLTGSLIFGIGTQLNNGLNGAIVYATNVNGNITTTYNGTAMAGSYIDSGSNGLFFNDSITLCTTNASWYCPFTSPQPLSATNTSATGTSVTVSFSIVNADQLFSNSSVVAGNIGAPYCTNCNGISPEFDWGLPFFFGHPVFTGIQGMPPPAGTTVPAGPFFAY